MVKPETVFKRLVRMVPDLVDLEVGTARVSRPGEPWMDLHLDVLERGDDEGRPWLRLALAHYYKQNGDLVPVPDMTVRVWPELGWAEALSFQNALYYKEVYPEPGLINVTQKVSQNSFLAMWLLNAWRQGHQLGPEAAREDA